MANGENELEIGRKELTLDRPPSLNNSPISSPNNVKKELNLQDDSKDNIKTLTVNNDDLIDKLNNEKLHEQEIPSGVPINHDVIDEAIITNKEENDELMVNNDNDVVVGLKEEHYSNEPVILDSPQVNDRKKHRYHRGKILNSCLKGSVSAEISSDDKKVKKGVHFPEKEDVKERIDPVDPWRDGNHNFYFKPY